MFRYKSENIKTEDISNFSKKVRKNNSVLQQNSEKERGGRWGRLGLHFLEITITKTSGNIYFVSKMQHLMGIGV